MKQPPEGFHYQDNIYFNRLNDGSIKITKYEGGLPVFSITVDFESWVSIVYSLTGNKGNINHLEEALEYEA